MTQIQQTGPGVSALLEEFDSLERLFDGSGRMDEDLSLCFLCLRWTTGDEGCRCGYLCERQLKLDELDASNRN